jgi:hypothetical protein
MQNNISVTRIETIEERFFWTWRFSSENDLPRYAKVLTDSSRFWPAYQHRFEIWVKPEYEKN